MSTLRRESSAVVIRAISWVMMVANTKCHVVNSKAEESQASSGYGATVNPLTKFWCAEQSAEVAEAMILILI